MKPTKHTPAPWKVTGTTIKNASNTIAFVDFTANSETTRANAQLIASAPALLDALSEILKVAEKQLDQSATHDGLANADILARARKAIANATV